MSFFSVTCFQISFIFSLSLAFWIYMGTICDIHLTKTNKKVPTEPFLFLTEDLPQSRSKWLKQNPDKNLTRDTQFVKQQSRGKPFWTGPRDCLVHFSANQCWTYRLSLHPVLRFCLQSTPVPWLWTCLSHESTSVCLPPLVNTILCSNDNTSLYNDNTSLCNDNTSLHNGNTSLCNDNTRLQNDNTSLYNDNTSLCNDNTSLQNDKTSLILVYIRTLVYIMTILVIVMTILEYVTTMLVCRMSILVYVMTLLVYKASTHTHTHTIYSRSTSQLCTATDGNTPIYICDVDWSKLTAMQERQKHSAKNQQITVRKHAFQPGMVPSVISGCPNCAFSPA